MKDEEISRSDLIQGYHNYKPEEEAEKNIPGGNKTISKET